MPAELLARLHRRIDVLADENPDLIEKLLAFLTAVDDDDETPDDAETPTPLTPAGCGA
jgi:hypothetical protein